MICEFKNNLERYIHFIMGENSTIYIKKEIYLIDVINTIITVILITVFFAWWILPIKILIIIINKILKNIKINLNPKFVCSKNKK